MAKKRLSPEEQKQREAEIWESPVRSDGVGEDPVIAGLQDFDKMTNVQALDLALALQKLIRGQNSLLENQKEMDDKISKLYARMHEMDQQAAKWENDRQRFVEEVTARADRVRMTEEKQERVRAQAAIDLTEATQRARAQMSMDRKAYDDWLKQQPTETVVSPGKIITVTEGGQLQARLLPEELRIKHRIWRFPPGQPVEVPKPIADALRSRRMSEEETSLRQELMQKNLESGTLEKKMKEIDQKYKSFGSMGAAEAATLL